MPTNSEKIDSLMKNVIEINVTLKERFDLFRRDIDEQKQDIVENEESTTAVSQKIAALEERIKSLEKSNDRTWQFVPIVLSAIAILVSLLVAFLKK